MSKPDFARALAEADRVLGEENVPARLALELRGERRRRPAPARWGWALAVPAVAAAAVLVLLPRGQRELGGLHVLEASSDARLAEVGTAVELSQGRCTLEDPASRTRLSLASSGSVRKEGTGVRVLRGTVEVEVDKRPAGAEPARIQVSGGAIAVLGTRFTVAQREGAGEVTLHEGRIRFESLDGRTVALAPGQTLSWPLPEPVVPRAPDPAPVRAPAPAHPVRPREPALAPAPETVVGSEAFIHHLDELRTRGRYAEAAQMLRQALAQPLESEARERLSYELGTLLSYHLVDRAQACAHWSAHRRAFGDGRYALEVAEASRTLGCAP